MIFGSAPVGAVVDILQSRIDGIQSPSRLERPGAGACLVHVEGIDEIEISRTDIGYVEDEIGSDLPLDTDRKSTRLNSSHQIISYAVFCLKKKKKNQKHENP